MFGWEFPPHISGGLGTACFGLTQSLVRQKIEVLFVVPKLHGNENPTNLDLIDASNITIPFAGGPRIVKRKVRVTKKSYPEELAEVTIHSHRRVANLTYIEVPAVLNPYSLPTLEEKNRTVKNWNYVFDSTTEKPEDQITHVEEEREVIEIGYHYQFSGTYGDRLHEEVKQYALVGKELGRQFSHDVIHAHDWMTFPAAIEARKVSGKPMVIHIHATEIDRSGSSGGYVYDIEKHGMNCADRIVAVSQWTKDIIINHYGIDPSKIIVVHNGVSASSQAVEEAPPPVGSHVVTYLGRVTHQKGPVYFVEAARKVADSFPDAHFIVAGSGDLLPQTIERVAQLRLSNKFHFTGFLNKEWINKIWSISNVYVMPSVSEPFGITPLEALQAGVPVVISNQSGVAEVMPHALKVNFWDVDALAESICSVLKYKSLSSMLKKKGEKEVRRLSWYRAAFKIKTLYEELIAYPPQAEKGSGALLPGTPTFAPSKIQVL